MDHFAMLTPHEQLVETALHLVQRTFVKDLRNSLRTTRKSGWKAGGPRGLC